MKVFSSSAPEISAKGMEGMFQQGSFFLSFQYEPATDALHHRRESIFKRGFNEGIGQQQNPPEEPESKTFSNIRDVYADNLQEEMDKIVQIVEDYPFVAIGINLVVVGTRLFIIFPQIQNFRE